MKPEMLQKHPPGPFRDQWQEKASVRTHASLCSKEEENSMTRAAVCVRVCVCACVCVCEREREREKYVHIYICIYLKQGFLVAQQ